MNVTLNGLQDYSNIVAFTGTPTILTVSDSGNDNYAYALISVQSMSPINPGLDYWIDVNGHKIHSTGDISLAQGQRFWINGHDSSDNRVYMAHSIMKALNNIPAVSANYDVYQTYSTGTMNSIVAIRAKSPGPSLSITASTNFNNSTVNLDVSNPTSTNPLVQGTVSNTVNLDIYKLLQPTKIGSSATGTQTFVVHLEKNITGNDVSFDLSSVITGMCEYNQLTQFRIELYTISDTKVTNAVTLNNLYATTGYAVNQGFPFIPNFSGIMLAQNVSRGADRQFANNSLMYVYYPNIMIPLYTDNTTSSVSITANYMNSAGNTISTDSYTISTPQSLGSYNIGLNTKKFHKATYIDLAINGLGTVRYNVIRPLNATDARYCQRIYWTNSYGGTSFFDFTGERTEQRKTSVDYYEKQLYDYYTSTNQERRKVYNKDVDITVTLTTHNIERDGTWQLFDLQNSTNAWTTINGNNYKITVNDLAINESNTVNGIYTGQVKYEYSLADTL